MFCCNNKTFVVQTFNELEGIKRRRKCTVCKKTFYTKEILIPSAEKRPVTQDPEPDARGLYTEEGATAVKMKHVEVRRKNEDRVSNYYIEDDYDF